jgi:hypothetical protein
MLLLLRRMEQWERDPRLLASPPLPELSLGLVWGSDRAVPYYADTRSSRAEAEGRMPVPLALRLPTHDPAARPAWPPDPGQFIPSAFEVWLLGDCPSPFTSWFGVMRSRRGLALLRRWVGAARAGGILLVGSWPAAGTPPTLLLDSQPDRPDPFLRLQAWSLRLQRQDLLADLVYDIIEGPRRCYGWPGLSTLPWHLRGDDRDDTLLPQIELLGVDTAYLLPPVDLSARWSDFRARRLPPPDPLAMPLSPIRILDRHSLIFESPLAAAGSWRR